MKDLKIVKKNNYNKECKFTYFIYYKKQVTYINSDVELDKSIILSTLFELKENGTADSLLLDSLFSVVSDYYTIYDPNNYKLVIKDSLDLEIALNEYIYN